MKKAVLFVAAFLFTITNVNAMTLSEYLVSRANNIETATYEDGNKSEMYTFNHPATEQTGELTDYRYIGNLPNNYVYFNCKDDNDTSTCELWRIIGVFEVEDENGNVFQRVKLIRDSGVGNYPWHDDENPVTSGNVYEWSTASLNTYLNKEYYYEKLSNSAKSMVGYTKYYLGNMKGPSHTSELYELERGTITNGGSFTYWIGKIGLMYPSDYVYTYALGIDDQCFTTISGCASSKPISGWIFNGENQWALTQMDGIAYIAFYVTDTGNSVCNVINYAYSVRPVLYLTSDIYIKDGDGSKNNPYQLTLTKATEDDMVSSAFDIQNPETGFNLIYILPIIICSIFFIGGITRVKKRLVIRGK